MPTISNWFIRLAVLWFVVGVALGIWMGITQNFTQAPVHAHVNLLGWVTMVLFALFYRAWPKAAASRLAKLHFWIYAPSHLLMMAGLSAMFAGVQSAGPVLGIGSVGVGVAVLVFAVIAWQATETQPAAAGIVDADMVRPA